MSEEGEEMEGSEEDEGEAVDGSEGDGSDEEGGDEEREDELAGVAYLTAVLDAVAERVILAVQVGRSFCWVLLSL